MNESRARHSGDTRFAAVMLAPAFSFVLCIAVYPILRVLWLSLFEQNLGTGLQPEFAGLHNYRRLLNDGHYFQSLANTALFTFCAVTLEFLLGLAFALLLNRRFAGRAAARASALIPWAMPTAVLALAWTWIFNDQAGVLNDLLFKTGLIQERIAWLGSGGTAMASLIIADVWKTVPFMTIILLAGLQNIPEQLYEAGQIDGAGVFNQFRLITLPLLTPSIMLSVLFRSIQSFGVFDLVYVMTGGGPGGATETVAIYNYNTYLRYLDFGYGSAMIVATFLIMAVISLAIYWPLSRTRGARI
jgi:multiple sugar transport system permease protein